MISTRPILPVVQRYFFSHYMHESLVFRLEKILIISGLLMIRTVSVVPYIFKAKWRFRVNLCVYVHGYRIWNIPELIIRNLINLVSRICALTHGRGRNLSSSISLLILPDKTPLFLFTINSILHVADYPILYLYTVSDVIYVWSKYRRTNIFFWKVFYLLKYNKIIFNVRINNCHCHGKIHCLHYR